MRVNVYAEEMTDRIELIRKEIEGTVYTAVRFYLELPATVNGQNVSGPFMHRPGDDDSAAVTFWGKRDLAKVLRNAFGSFGGVSQCLSIARNRGGKLGNYGGVMEAGTPTNPSNRSPTTLFDVVRLP